MDILEEILENKKKELKRTKINSPFLSLEKTFSGEVKSFKDSINKKNKISLIAEIKKASPSKGVIKSDFNPVKIADVYEKNGVSAISVLTESKYFMGSTEILKSVKKTVDIPILRKDFIFDDYQIKESQILGASAILLIVAAFKDNKQLSGLIEKCKEYNLDALVETHNEKEIETALKANAEIIGINNRNLKTFKTDINTTFNLCKMIPNDIVKVSESGISTNEQIKSLQDAGINAVLIGESIMKENNIATKIQELMK